jgi:hypothetical protein
LKYQEIIENTQACSSNVDITLKSEAEEKHGDEPPDENISLSEALYSLKKFARMCPLLLIFFSSRIVWKISFLMVLLKI